MNTLRRIRDASVWNKTAYTGKERKYRSLTRIWLPIYDVLLFLCGLNAANYGSQLLDRIFGSTADILGMILCGVAVACFIGVTFPKVVLLEVFGKCAMFGMFVTYMFMIAQNPSESQQAFSSNPNWFVISMISVGTPLALFRLNLIAEIKFEKRVADRVTELTNTGEIGYAQ